MITGRWARETELSWAAALWLGAWKAKKVLLLGDRSVLESLAGEVSADCAERSWAVRREQREWWTIRGMEHSRATIIDDLASLELHEPGETAAAVYDRAIGLRPLHQDGDSGEEHYLIRYPAGTRGRVHRHTAAHTIVVLEGRLQTNDQVIGPGGYAHFPGGVPMRHQAADGQACLFVIMFHGPFDVEIVREEGDLPGGH